jgi:chorismate synthase
MTSFWGNHLKLSVFGESHGKAIGAVLDGLPAGISIDEAAIAKEMDRRASRGKSLATPRKEADAVNIVSGFFEGHTTGTPLTGVIENTNTRSKDYARTKDKMRPGHADYTAWLKYGGYQDYRGGGHFSGRLTAPIVFAGAVAKQVLAAKADGLQVGSRILRIGAVADESILPPQAYADLQYGDANWPVIDKSCIPRMQAAVFEARADKDSVGGIIEGYVTGVPGGLGSPMFETVESRLAALLFAIPAAKGVEFGTGFAMSGMRGSEANDTFYMAGDQVKTRTNHNGGINGGITNGMPLVFRVAFKPTPSIARPQATIDMARREDTTIEITGRHDPCIVLRAIPVVEAVTALCLLDLILEDGR